MKRNDLSRSLIAFDQATTLVAVVELSRGSWLAAGLVPHLTRQPLKKLRSDPDALLGLLLRWRDQAIKAGGRIKRIVLAFEAGRDGFWLVPLSQKMSQKVAGAAVRESGSGAIPK